MAGKLRKLNRHDSAPTQATTIDPQPYVASGSVSPSQIPSELVVHAAPSPEDCLALLSENELLLNGENKERANELLDVLSGFSKEEELLRQEYAKQFGASARPSIDNDDDVDFFMRMKSNVIFTNSLRVPDDLISDYIAAKTDSERVLLLCDSFCIDDLSMANFFREKPACSGHYFGIYLKHKRKQLLSVLRENLEPSVANTFETLCDLIYSDSAKKCFAKPIIRTRFGGYLASIVFRNCPNADAMDMFVKAFFVAFIGSNAYTGSKPPMPFDRTNELEKPNWQIPLSGHFEADIRANYISKLMRKAGDSLAFANFAAMLLFSLAQQITIIPLAKETNITTCIDDEFFPIYDWYDISRFAEGEEEAAMEEVHRLSHILLPVKELWDCETENDFCTFLRSISGAKSEDDGLATTQFVESSEIFTHDKSLYSHGILGYKVDAFISQSNALISKEIEEEVTLLEMMQESIRREKTQAKTIENLEAEVKDLKSRKATTVVEAAAPKKANENELEKLQESNRKKSTKIANLEEMITSMKEKITKLERTISEIDEEICSYSEKNDDLQTEADTLRKQLNALDVDLSEEACTDEDFLLDTSVFGRKKAVIVGGHNNWVHKMRELHESIEIYGSDGPMPSNDALNFADVIWIQTNAINHSTYYRVCDFARQHGIYIRYFTTAGHVTCRKEMTAETTRLFAS